MNHTEALTHSFDLITALIKIEIKERQTSGEVKGVIG
jgi:hypothetical protein